MSKFTPEEKAAWREAQRSLGKHMVKVHLFNEPARSMKPLSKEKRRRLAIKARNLASPVAVEPTLSEREIDAIIEQKYGKQH